MKCSLQTIYLCHWKLWQYDCMPFSWKNMIWEECRKTSMICTVDWTMIYLILYRCYCDNIWNWKVAFWNLVLLQKGVGCLCLLYIIKVVKTSITFSFVLNWKKCIFLFQPYHYRDENTCHVMKKYIGYIFIYFCKHVQYVQSWNVR